MSASPRHGLQGFSVRELSPEGQLRIISEPEYGTLKAVEAPKYKDHMADIWSRDIPLLQKIELSAKMTVFGDDPWRWNGVPDHFQQPSTFGSELRGFGKELLNMGLTALDVVTGYSGLAPQFSISPSEIDGANAAKMLPVVGIFGRASKAGGAVDVSGAKSAPTKPDLNRFHQAASELPQQAQQNIRSLRGWAKSKGYTKMPNPQGSPEKWGAVVDGKSKPRLVIKPEASTRPGLAPGSDVPRFDARLADGVYVNPFTGGKGTYREYSHIPLENPFPVPEYQFNKIPGLGGSH